ncbi:hypothetical protein [robinz microvirus RP_97]|nr:hypothetical protein [robinz microvirus RP_97]
MAAQLCSRLGRGLDRGCRGGTPLRGRRPSSTIPYLMLIVLLGPQVWGPSRRVESFITLW